MSSIYCKASLEGLSAQDRCFVVGMQHEASRDLPGWVTGISSDLASGPITSKTRWSNATCTLPSGNLALYQKYGVTTSSYLVAKGPEADRSGIGYCTRARSHLPQAGRSMTCLPCHEPLQLQCAFLRLLHNRSVRSDAPTSRF